MGFQTENPGIWKQNDYKLQVSRAKSGESLCPSKGTSMTEKVPLPGIFKALVIQYTRAHLPHEQYYQEY